jgi:hypothetical protein
MGVTITDAAVHGEMIAVFCDLLTEGAAACPGSGQQGQYRDTAIRKVTDVPVVAIRCGCECGCRATAARQSNVIGKCSPTTLIGWPAAGRPPLGIVPATFCAA